LENSISGHGSPDRLAMAAVVAPLEFATEGQGKHAGT